MDTYRTSDLYYAAYLKTAGVPFVGVDHTDHRVVFLFGPESGISDLKSGYFTGSSRVSALAFVQEIRHLKSLVHRALGGNFPSPNG